MDLEAVSNDEKSNWHPIRKIHEVKSLIESFGGQYQVPIQAPKGSFIIWASSLIHSAKMSIQKEVPTLEDPYKGWRCLVYVCYRPKSQFSKKELIRRASVVKDNRCTNHWGTKVFAKKPGSTWRLKFHPEMEKMLVNPSLMYEKISLKLTQDQLKLANSKSDLNANLKRKAQAE